MTNIVANQIENPSAESGKLFACSEIDAHKALEMFARAVGEAPTYASWIASRTDWVNGYTEAKPQAKGNSADQAFSRFARRLTDTFGITAPKAQTEAATKKAEERQAKAEKLAEKYSNHTTEQLTESLKKAYELQAKNPTKKLATLKELEQVVKARTKDQEAEARETLKEARARLFELAKLCDDADLIHTAADVLDTANFEVTIS